MKRLTLVLLSTLLFSCHCFSQAKLLNVKSKRFKTAEGLKIEGQIGFLEVPENRTNSSSRKIKLKYVHLKSLSENPSTPVIYLEGGDGVSTWEANSPQDLNDRVELLKTTDLIFLDRRGSSDEALTYIPADDYPKGFFLSEEKATQHYQKMSETALKNFDEKQIDISGYNIEAHAQDVNELMTKLGFDRYIIFGFSYGSHIGMTVMRLYPDEVERAIFVGADAPHQAFNFPRHLDEHIEKIGLLIEKESTLKMTARDFHNLVNETVQKLEENPVIVTVKHPLTRKDLNLPIGGFGLALILRLDIDDANDIPVIPRLLHSIKGGDYSMLTWFVQKRMIWALGLPGQGINQQLASGASQERWSMIEKEAQESVFGNVVNFPFSAVKDHWPITSLSFDPSIPLKTDIPTLFITGTLDCRTPVAQVESIIQGFANAAHIRVENAGHEQAQWAADVADNIIPSFVKGAFVAPTTVYYSDIEFVNLTGDSSRHPSIK